MSSYILEESLVSYDMVIKYKPSLIAAAAVLIGRHAVGRHNWSPTLLKYSVYREEEIISIAREMIAARNALSTLYPGLDALKSKYSRNGKFRDVINKLPTKI